jgi:hypothetical protein
MIIPPVLSGPLDGPHLESFFHHAKDGTVSARVRANLTKICLTITSTLTASPYPVCQIPYDLG